MNKAKAVMTREEALALPISQRPICYRISSAMYHQAFEAIGHAAECWKVKPPPDTFRPGRATNVAIGLCFKIAEELEARTAKLHEAFAAASALLDSTPSVALIDERLGRWNAARNAVLADRELQAPPAEPEPTPYQATVFVHSPSGAQPCCKKHAEKLMAILANLGVHSTAAPAAVGVQCRNCLNEAPK